MHRSIGLVLLVACGSVEPEKPDATIPGDVDTTVDADIDAESDAAIDAPPEPIAAGLIIFFDGACPTGFTERTDLANLYLRGHDGDSMYEEKGGATTHVHQVATHNHMTALAGTVHSHAVTFGASAQSTISTPGGAVRGAAPAHTHTATSTMAGGPHTHSATAFSGAFSTGTGPTDPMFREVVLCEVTATVTMLPPTAIALSASSCAAGWTTADNAAGRLLRGHDRDGNIAEIGGTATHSHTMAHANGAMTAAAGDHAHTATSGAPSTTIDDLVAAGSAPFASAAHTHTVSLTSGAHVHSVPSFSGSTAVASEMPEYREVMTCHPTSPSPLPVDALAISTGPCPSGWIEVVEYRNRFLGGDDGDATPSEIAGGAHTHDATHTHGSTGTSSHSHATTGGASTGTTIARDTNSRPASPDGHTHAISVGQADSHAHAIDPASPAVTAVEALPPYVEVVVCTRE